MQALHEIALVGLPTARSPPIRVISGVGPVGDEPVGTPSRSTAVSDIIVFHGWSSQSPVVVPTPFSDCQ